MRLIDADTLIHELNNSHYPGAPYVDAGISIAIGKVLDAPTIEPEYKKKLKEIADSLSEKMSYMNTCLNERDVILGYLGVERPNGNHCNTDCRNNKCESYHYSTRKQFKPCEDTPTIEQKGGENETNINRRTD